MENKFKSEILSGELEVDFRVFVFFVKAEKKMSINEINNFFRVLENALEKNKLQNIYLKPKQVVCLKYIFEGLDVIAILPTGFGKSLIYQLLPWMLPVKEKNNIVIVAAPLNSIIEDQISSLKHRGINVAFLGNFPLGYSPDYVENLFDESNTVNEDEEQNIFPLSIMEGEISFLFAHPESLLSKDGRLLLRSKIYQRNVVAVVVDEAHCVEMW